MKFPIFINPELNAWINTVIKNIKNSCKLQTVQQLTKSSFNFINKFEWEKLTHVNVKLISISMGFFVCVLVIATIVLIWFIKWMYGWFSVPLFYIFAQYVGLWLNWYVIFQSIFVSTGKQHYITLLVVSMKWNESIFIIAKAIHHHQTIC